MKHQSKKDKMHESKGMKKYEVHKKEVRKHESEGMKKAVKKDGLAHKKSPVEKY